MIDPADTSQLLPHESLVWSGRTATGVRLAMTDLIAIPFGIFIFVFAITWVTGANAGGAPVFFWAFGVPFMLIGLFVAFGRFVADAWARRNTRYAAADRQALIVRGAPISKFTAIGLDRLPEMSLLERADGSGTIMFGQKLGLMGSPYGRELLGSLMPSFDLTPAFHLIADARGVFDSLRQRVIPAAS